MARYGDIFGRLRLTPGQLRSVADRRFDDAAYLLTAGDAARANGAMYLGGFVIECLLKASLLARHPNLGIARDPAILSATDRVVYAQLYSHELDQMLDSLAEVPLKLERHRQGLARELAAVCAEWTVYARYSPRLATLQQAKDFLSVVREVRPVLREV